MSLRGRRFVTGVLLLALALCARTPALADEYPSRPITFIVSFAPGGVADTAARLFAGSLQRARGVSMRRGRHIEIRRPAAGPAHLDGEPVTLPQSLTIDVVPRSLRILLPDERRTI